MTETEIRRLINQNQSQYRNANDPTKALLLAQNESLAKQLDTLTGGKSVYDAGTGTWNLSASKQGAIDRYTEERDLLASSAYGGYNAENDPAYSALKKSTLRESDRSVEDTMGAYAGMTGGIPSTAAVTAAQETANYFRGQLADQQVALGEQDYARWLNEQQARQNMLNIYKAEAEESAASLAALGDFSAMGKLYGWSADQIAEAERNWAAQQYSGGGGSGGYSGGSDEEVTGLPEDTSGIPAYVLAALGYGDVPQREDRFSRPDDQESMTKKETKYNNRTESQIYSMVQQLITRYKDPERVRKIINSGNTFTANQAQVANVQLDALISGGAFN